MKKVLLVLLMACLFVTGCDSDNENPTGSIVEERNSGSSALEQKETTSVSAETIKLGETKEIKSTYDDEEIEVTIKLDDMYISSVVNPPEPKQSYYTYYPEYDGKTYLVVVLDVKNLGGKKLNTDYVFTNFLGDNCKTTVKADGKYEYTSSTVVGLEKDSNGKFDFDSYYYMEPLEQNKLYVLYQIPTEVKDKPMNVNVCLGDKKVNLVKE